MKVVYKYTLKINEPTKVEITKNSEILCFKIQNEVPCVWILIDLEEPKKWLEWFLVKGTGHEIDESLNLKYIGTDLSEGSYVWHCFQVL